jgi:hypothetical protein
VTRQSRRDDPPKKRRDLRRKAPEASQKVPPRAITCAYATHNEQRFQRNPGLADNDPSIDGVKYRRHVHSLRLLKP